MVNITNLRKAAKGTTHRKGVKETRGRNKKLSKANLAAIQRARKALIKKADSEFEAAWPAIIRMAGWLAGSLAGWLAGWLTVNIQLTYS